MTTLCKVCTNYRIAKSVFLILFITAIALIAPSCAREETEESVTTTTSALPESKLVETVSDELFEYTVYADYVEITAYYGAAAEVVIPALYQNRPVLSIGKSAFYGNTTVTSVSMPETVLNVANKAFAKCSSLTTVTMPGIRAIGMESFRGSALTAVTLPETLENLGKYSFAETKLTTVTLPSSIIRAGDYVFAGCQELTSFTFPENATEITKRMFYNCGSLTEVTIPAHIKTLGDYAFSNCVNLTSIYIPASVTEVGEGLLYNSANVIIRTPAGSAAEKYAQSYSISYENVEPAA